MVAATKPWVVRSIPARALAVAGLFMTLLAGQGTPSPHRVAATIYAQDGFNRSIANGWGAADIGGSWSATGPAYSVTPGSAIIVADPTSPTNFLAAGAATDVDAVARITPPLIGARYVDSGMAMRHAAGSGAFYQVSVYYATSNNSGNYTVELKRKPENVQINRDVNTNIPGGTPLWMRVQAQGVNPTTLRWRVWADGTSEPAGWTGIGVDGTAALQTGGGVGFEAYADAGTASVGFNTLTVQAIVAPPPAVNCASNAIACDTFSRTTNGSWGAADVGGRWNAAGAAYAVAPGSASIAADATSPANFLAGTSAQNVDAEAKISPPATSSSWVDIGVGVRYSPASGTYYQLSVYYSSANNGGAYTAELKREPDNAAIVPDTNTAIPGGTAIWLRLQAQGGNPTTLRWRIWSDGNPEPAAWSGTASDGTPALQGAGGVGLKGYSNTGSPTIVFNAFSVTPLPAPPAASCPSGVADCDTFNRTATGGWGTADTGGAWQATGSAYSVSPGAGTIVADSTAPRTFLASSAIENVDAQAKITPPPMTSAYVDAGIGVRYSSGAGTFYQVSAYDASGNNGGRYTVQLKRKPENIQITPDFNTALPAGGSFWLRLQAQGVSPTILQWKIWLDGSPEPSTWTGSGIDSTAALQVAGGVGVEAYSSVGTTSMRFSVLWASALAAPPPPAPFSCASGAVACDTYARTTTNGWGAADVGGSWTITGTPSHWAVSNGGAPVTAAPGTMELAGLNQVSVENVEILIEVALPMCSRSSNCAAYVLGRRISGSAPAYYRIGVMQSAGSPTVLIRTQRSDGAMVAADADTGIAATNGLVVWLRAQFQGVRPTSLRARAWARGAAEPAYWTVDTTDSTAALQAAGSVGVRVRDEDTSAARTFEYRGFQAVALSAPTPIPAGFVDDTFSRTVSNGWGNADTGGAWSTGGSGFAVTPGRGTMVATSAVPTNFLTATSVQDVDARIRLVPPSISGNYVDGGIALRYEPATGMFYQLSAYYASGNNAGAYTVQLKRKPSNTLIRPDFNTTIPGGTALWLRLEVQGIAPTTLRWKVWQDGTPEPAVWAATAVDNTPGLEGPGGVGLQSYCSSGASIVAFDGLSAVRL